MSRITRTKVAVQLLAKLLLLSLIYAGIANAEVNNTQKQFIDWLQQQPKARDFPKNLDWLNTGGQALELEQLRGRMVLLDFWTYGCINCLHIIPALKAMEDKYGDDLVVIGVHSAKFAHEGNTDNIRNLVSRYGLEHPVVNDREFTIWNRYRARGWPTLVMIDPQGHIAGRWLGENEMSTIDELGGRLQALITDEQRSTRQKLNLIPEMTVQNADSLRFPSKLLVDGDNNRLFIADTGNNRIVITDLNGHVEEVIGGKAAGLADGPFDTALFSFPRGLALADENRLFVADTGNHSIRLIDLKQQTVNTVAGTGEQTYQLQTEGPALSTGINSPWDVLWANENLYIAMAGQHQIWSYSPQKQQIKVFAGSRQEELRDGPRLKAGLNQPSGLASDGEYLYIADSEASAIRRVPLLGRHQQGEQLLETLVGTGLFDFGDVDGQGRQVRLQHPLAVALWRVFDQPDRLIIADSYNNKIKLLNPKTRQVSSLTDDQSNLHEPGGISVLGNQAFLADTNQHVIRVLNLQQGQIRTLELLDSKKRL